MYHAVIFTQLPCNSKHILRQGIRKINMYYFSFFNKQNAVIFLCDVQDSKFELRIILRNIARKLIKLMYTYYAVDLSQI